MLDLAGEVSSGQADGRRLRHAQVQAAALGHQASLTIMHVCVQPIEGLCVGARALLWKQTPAEWQAERMNVVL